MSTLPHADSGPRAVVTLWLLGLYALVVFGGIDRPFTTDEIYYAGWASGISETFTPEYYVGEIREALGRNLIEPLSHPPGHFMALAGMIKIFGLHYWSLRGLGVVLFTSAILFLALVIGRRFAWSWDRMLFIGTFCVLNPLFMREHLALAIEGQALWFPLLVFFYFFYLDVEAVREGSPKIPFVKSSLLLVLLFAIKETSIPIYVSACLAYLVVLRQRRALVLFGMSLIVAAVLFWSLWASYCYMFDLDVWSWLRFTVLNKMAPVSASRRITPLAIFDGIRLTTLWLSFPFVAFVFAAGWRLIAPRVQQKRFSLAAISEETRFMLLLVLYLASVVFFAKILRPGSFLKYENPGHFVLAIVLSWVVSRRALLSVRTLAWTLSIGVPLGLLAARFGEDRLLDYTNVYFYQMIAQLLATLAVVFFATRIWRGHRTTVFATLVGLTAFFNSWLFVEQTAGYTTSVSWYNYGDNAQAAIDWLVERIEPGDRLAAFKDIQFNMRFVEGFDRLETYEVRLFTRQPVIPGGHELLASGRIRWLQVGPFAPLGEVKSVVEKHFDAVYSQGPFEIYRFRPSSGVGTPVP
ncbi:MAG: hypothetical protein AAF735_01125 [Myxococcota bacterium]